MIIFRYLSKDLLVTTLAVTFVLLIIMLSTRLSGLLSDVAQGKLAADVLFTVIVYRLPGFLQLLFPTGFYISILLVYGRLYMESEMVVLFACGLSPRQLMTITLAPALVVAVVVGLFSFWLAPLGAELDAKVLEEQRNRSEFESLNAGRFQTLGQGQTMTYVDDITGNRKRLDGVFIARDGVEKSNTMVAVAEFGEQVDHPEYGQRYLVLHNGYRYEGEPGTADFRVTHFSTYGQYMPPPSVATEYTNNTDAKPTLELVRSSERTLQTALQFRLAWPILVFVATLLALPLSKTNPRQGRYLKMLPALLLYIFYFTFLNSVRGAMDAGKWPLMPGLWVVHIAFLFLAFVLMNWESFSFRSRRPAAEGVARA